MSSPDFMADICEIAIKQESDFARDYLDCLGGDFDTIWAGTSLAEKEGECQKYRAALMDFLVKTQVYDEILCPGAGAFAKAVMGCVAEELISLPQAMIYTPRDHTDLHGIWSPPLYMPAAEQGIEAFRAFMDSGLYWSTNDNYCENLNLVLNELENDGMSALDAGYMPFIDTFDYNSDSDTDDDYEV